MLVEKQSIHLENFPKINTLVDTTIVNKMDKVRSICNLVFALRKDENIRVRMPLKKIVICGNLDLDSEYLEIIKQETNVKAIEIFQGNVNDIASQEVVLDMKECGKLFGAKLKDILSAQKKGDWIIKDGKLLIAGEQIEKNLFKINYKSKEGLKALNCEEYNLIVLIDITTNEELLLEGLARDVVRAIQQTRKDNKLEINSRINVEIFVENDIFIKVVSSFKNYICEQTLTNDIIVKKIPSCKDMTNKYQVDNHIFSVLVSDA